MGKQSTFNFTDVDLVLIKGRSARWDGGVHLYHNFTEITSVRPHCFPPAARVDRGSRGSAPCLPACLPTVMLLNETQASLPQGWAQKMGTLSWAGRGALRAAKAASGLLVAQS